MGDLIKGGHLKTCFRNFLRAALYRVLPEGRPEDHHAGGAAAGGGTGVGHRVFINFPFNFF